VVILTGATGFLGAHILSALVTSAPPTRVYCLLRHPRRTGNPDSMSGLPAQDHLARSLASRHLSSVCPLGNVTALYAKLDAASDDADNLGLDQATLIALRATTTHIIHCAWPVNFAVALRSFEPAVRTVHNLLSFTRSCKNSGTPGSRVRFLFASSIAAAIAEIAVTHNADASSSGYGLSKLAAERIISAVARRPDAPIDASIFRIGQLIPSRRMGSRLWNPNESVPLLLRSTLTLGVLPRRDPDDPRDQCRWADADDVSQAMLVLGGLSPSAAIGLVSPYKLFNLVHPRTFSWNMDLLPALRRAGLDFEVVGWSEWLYRLESNESSIANTPAKKLLDHYKREAALAMYELDEKSVLSTEQTESIYPSMKHWQRATDGDWINEIIAVLLGLK
jgi:thioester reductase-like protein